MDKIFAGLAAAALAAGAAMAQTAAAAGGSVTVPKAGPKTVSTSWSGTVPLGTNLDTFVTAKPPADCSNAQAPFKSTHPFTVNVAPGAYSVVNATMAVTVDSSPALNADFIELVDPSGNSAGVDKQKKEMEVDVPNPTPGTWTLVTCQFIPDSAGTGHAYQATVTIQTKCKGASPCPGGPRKHKH